MKEIKEKIEDERTISIDSGMGWIILISIGIFLLGLGVFIIAIKF